MVTKSDSFYIPEPSSMDKFEGIVMLVETDIDLEKGLLEELGYRGD